MRTRIPFSAGWRFILGDASNGAALDDTAITGAVIAGAGAVDLPHTMVPLPENHFDEGGLFVQGSYFKEFDSPEHPPGGRVFLDFDGVAVSCSLWLNGKALGRHKGPYTPFSFDITDFLLSGKPNLLKILVSAREDPDIPPFGGVVDYLVPGGIYRGVWMRVQERFWLEELFARPKVIGFLRSEGEDQSQAPSRCKAELEVEAWVRGGETGGKLSIPGEAAVEARLEKDGRLIASVAVPARECVSETGHIVLKFPSLSDVELWDCDRPSLYAVRLVLGDFDSLSTRIGFRTARFTDKGFFLNGFRIFLQGLNRHQAWPASGYAMGPGPQRKDAELIARDYGSKIVRTSHYPQSPHFLDACDELGLLVFEELPGWQHIGGETWKEQALDDLAALILRDRNHPSIVLWGTRINESKDDRSFYARTAGLAKRLDPDRQTGGVRYLKGSELLEDVYTFNDFTHDGGFRVIAKPAKAIGASGAPYMITEHNGHMYPTKRFDQEERLAEHARRHARVLNAAMGDPAISGCIGWCAFDYHTHKDFGSGDRVCYHGVADMDRIPKFAAQLYASQQDPSKKIVLEAASLFAKGERSAARLLPVEVYTNCDAVDLYRGGDLVGRFYPDRKTYPYLDHPPVVLDDFIGRRIDKEGFSPPVKALFLDLAAKAMAKGAEGFNLWDKAKFGLFLAKTGLGFSAVEELVKRYGLAWGTKDDSFELVGILDGKEAARRRYGSESDARELRLGADVSELRFEPGGEWNAARVLVQVLDGYGRPCRFAFLPVRASVEGPGRILGPQEFSLIGGERAFWVATTGRSGSINVTAEVPGFPARTITLRALST